MRRIYISTSVRGEDFQKNDHGYLYLVDWDTKVILKRIGSFPHMCSRDSTNSRGGVRGWRGLAQKDSTLIAANNDSLVYFDEKLEKVKKIVSHPCFVDLHEICFDPFNKDLFVTSTGTDCLCIVKDDEVQVVKLFESLRLEETLKNHLFHRGRVPFVPEDNFDYRFTRREDTLHLNTCSFNSEGSLFVIFNSISIFGRLDNTNHLFEMFYSIKPEDVTSGGELPNMHDLKFIDAKNALTVSGSLSEMFLINVETGKFKSVFKNKLTDSGDNVNLSRNWLRGLDHKNGHAFAGCGDTTVIEVDINSGEEVDSFSFSFGNKESVFSVLLHSEDW